MSKTATVWCKVIALGTLFFGARSFGVDADRDEQLSNIHVDATHNMAYRNFGPPYWQPVGFWNYPVHTEKFRYPVLKEYAIPFRPGVAVNVGADSTGWVPIPVNDTAVYYRAEYLMKSIEGIDIPQLIAEATNYYKTHGRPTWDPNDFNSRPKDKKHKPDDLLDYNKAKMTMVLFPASQFRLKYFPGRQLIWRENGMVGRPFRRTPRGGVKWNPFYAKVDPAENGKLAGLFKGTFDNEDALRDGHLPGLVVDGTYVDQPTRDLATFALYNDDSFDVGTVPDLSLKNVKMLKQNEYLCLQHGCVNADGAYPYGWNRFPDDIIRSYLVTTDDQKYFGYVWTMYAHPSMTAAALQKIGFDNVMLLDIHPALGAVFARPMALKPESKTNFFSTTNPGSYPLIPREDQVMKGLWLSGASWAAKQYRGRMEWPFEETIDGTEPDFFGIYLK